MRALASPPGYLIASLARPRTGEGHPEFAVNAGGEAGGRARRISLRSRSTMSDVKLNEVLARVARGGQPKYHEKNAEVGKLFARDRIARLVDDGSFIEDAALANNIDSELPADGVITGTAKIAGRTVAIMA